MQLQKLSVLALVATAALAAPRYKKHNMFVLESTSTSSYPSLLVASGSQPTNTLANLTASPLRTTSATEAAVIPRSNEEEVNVTVIAETPIMYQTETQVVIVSLSSDDDFEPMTTPIVTVTAETPITYQTETQVVTVSLSSNDDFEPMTTSTVTVNISTRSDITTVTQFVAASLTTSYSSPESISERLRAAHVQHHQHSSSPCGYIATH